MVSWVDIILLDSLLKKENMNDIDAYAKLVLTQSYQNCLNFPWIKQQIDANQLHIHLWFFDIKQREIQAFCESSL